MIITKNCLQLNIFVDGPLSHSFIEWEDKSMRISVDIMLLRHSLWELKSQCCWHADAISWFIAHKSIIWVLSRGHGPPNRIGPLYFHHNNLNTCHHHFIFPQFDGKTNGNSAEREPSVRVQNCKSFGRRLSTNELNELNRY